MIDCFGLLNEPRRPWLDPESLKRKFLALSAADHPDKVHQGTLEQKREAQERYTQLNAAYHCLRNEKERLAHFLELERGAKPEQLQRVPPELMELSLEISRSCREADACVAETGRTDSALLKVQLFERSHQLTEGLLALQGRIRLRREALLDQLKNLDREWATLPGAGIPERSRFFQEIEDLYRLFGYFNRWTRQVQERVGQLAF